MDKRLRQKCIQRWGCIPVDVEWVETAMKDWEYVEVIPEPISDHERKRKDILILYYKSVGVVYV
jgi:hypothetical protein